MATNYLDKTRIAYDVVARLGLAVRGIDLSPRMIEVARRDHPDLPFEVGSLLDLDLPDGALGGLVAWYSPVHTPRHLLPAEEGEKQPQAYVLGVKPG